jgi:hypothetical protein
MKNRFPDAKEIYRLRDYAILKAKDGTYEYVAWESDKINKKLQWIAGKSVVLDNLLVLTRITASGEESTYKDLKELRKALKKLPDWWEKTAFYCVVVDQFASTPCHCTTGQPVDENSEDFKKIQDLLRRVRVILTARDTSGKPKGIARAVAGATDPF